MGINVVALVRTRKLRVKRSLNVAVGLSAKFEENGKVLGTD